MDAGPVVQQTKTTCPYCGVGCGVIVDAGRGGRSLKGDPDHPANFGRLCSKGSALLETIGLEDRLLAPMVGGRETSWDAAIAAVADAFQKSIAAYGPDSVAFYVSGQLLTEDYYVANKLMKGYIGSANIDTNSRLCMASSVAGHKRAFGADSVPGCYEDLELADLVVLVGSNLAWCHPVLYQRLAAAKNARPGMQVVVIDPRRTATCDVADLHLALAPGSDVALFQGLLTYLNDSSARNADYIAAHTEGVDGAVAAAACFDVAAVAEATQLSTEDIRRFYAVFAATDKTVTVYSQGVNQAVDGTDKVNAIINCHLLTGRIGRPGMGPFSVTGQPNAMGGREVGGLANQLASHMELDNPEHRALVQSFWRSPAIAKQAGLKALDLFDAVYNGDVKALWIISTNPVVSMPNADRVREALERCAFVAVSDVTAMSDTVRYADVVLPSKAWGEKNGVVTNSERRMSRQRAFLPSPGEARSDWRQMCDLATAMGWGDHFAYTSTADIFREYAELCSHGSDIGRDLDMAGVGAMDQGAYDRFAPVQWPVADAGISAAQNVRLFAEGVFFTESGRANFVALDAKTVVRSDTFPLVLNSGRVRDHWHTMTRTGKSARLSQHIAEPFVEIAPEDAAALKLSDADIAKVSSPQGQVLARVLITDRQQRGSVFMPMHWTDHFASNSRVDRLTHSVADPVSGQPALKSTPVAVKKFEADWYGFAALADAAAVDPKRSGVLEAVAYWAKARTAGGWRFEMAGMGAAPGGSFFAGLSEELYTDGCHVVLYTDEKAQSYRYAFLHNDQLLGVLFVGPAPVDVARTWIVTLIGQTLSPAQRARLLAGRPGGDVKDPGAIVCSCMQVGRNHIADAVRAGCSSVDDIGRVTQAGTNCGSCRAELQSLLKEPVHA